MNSQEQTTLPFIIFGGIHTDERGTVSFVNNFDMTPIKRMYTISHRSTAVVRAWQGHKNEQKFFKCIKGSFTVTLVKIDNWVAPSIALIPMVFELSAKRNEILCIPAGYANGFKALAADSELLIFSDQNLEDSSNDNYRFNDKLWFNWSKGSH